MKESSALYVCSCMKRCLLLLTLLQCLSISAQIRITEFQRLAGDPAAVDPETLCRDREGDLCAVLKLETPLSGWTFETGLAGIMDVRYERGAIYLYVPCSVRKLTVAHVEYGVLRDWEIPESLTGGCTYAMKLYYTRPASAVKSSVRPVPVRMISSKENSFCEHFIDLYTGLVHEKYDAGYGASDQYILGFSYTWIGARIGPYLSVGTDFDGTCTVAAGAAFRATRPETSSLDWQLYAGIGLLDGCPGIDAGMRLAWRSASSVSKADFGVGVQVFPDAVVPTVSVGLYIWGIPLMVGIGLICSAL